MRRGYIRLQVDNVLKTEMDTVSSDIVDFCRVVLAKRVLDTEVPVDRIRIVDLRRNPVRGVGNRVSPIKNRDAAAAPRKTAASKKSSGYVTGINGGRGPDLWGTARPVWSDSALRCRHKHESAQPLCGPWSAFSFEPVGYSGERKVRD